MNMQPLSVKSISAVIPVYNDQDVLDELYKRLVPVLKSLSKVYEIVFVDDGSKDDSFVVLRKIQSSDSNIKIVRLARNFGQQSSISAGLDYASNEYIALMDSDLQDKPEDIPLLLGKLIEEDKEMAIAKWITREDSFFKKLFSDLFFMVSSRITNIKYQKGLGVFRIIRKSAYDQLRIIPENTGTIISLMYWSGLDYVTVELHRDSRFAGQSGYNLKKMLNLSADRIFSYSLFPIKLASTFGMLLGFASFIFGIVLVIKKLLYNNIVPGWTSTMVLVALLFGINFIFLGIIGEYLGRIYVEAKGRPKYIIGRIYDPEKNINHEE